MGCGAIGGGKQKYHEVEEEPQLSEIDDPKAKPCWGAKDTSKGKPSQDASAAQGENEALEDTSHTDKYKAGNCMTDMEIIDDIEDEELPSAEKKWNDPNLLK